MWLSRRQVKSCGSINTRLSDKRALAAGLVNMVFVASNLNTEALTFEPGGAFFGIAALLLLRALSTGAR